MSQVSLRAIASPVDIFSPDGVAGPAVSGGLADLARSLSSFSGSVGRLAQYRSKEEQKAGLEEALNIQRQRRLTNIEQYRGLVESGEIEEGQNPWKLVFLRQLVAREQVSQAALRAETEFYQSRPADPDDIAGIQSQMRSRVLEAVQGLDSFEFQAVAGQVDDFVAGFTGRYQTRRERERVLETDEQLTTAVQRLFPNEPESAERLSTAFNAPEGSDARRLADGALADLQALSDAAVATTPPARVRDRMFAAIELAAVQTQNAELAEQLLNRLTVDGAPLAEYAEAGYVAKIRENVERSQVSDLQLSATRDRLARQALLEPVIEQINRSTDPINEPISEELQTLLGEQIDQLRQQRAQALAESRLSRGSSALLSKTLTPEGRATLVESLILLGSPGATALDRFLRFEARQNERDPVWASETSLRAAKALARLQYGPRVGFSEAFDELDTLAASGEITYSDWRDTLSQVSRRTSPSGEAITATIRSAQTEVETRVMAAIPREFDLTTNSLQPDAQAVAELDRALASVGKAIRVWTDRNPDADQQALDAYIDGIVDFTVTDLGGMTAEQERELRPVMQVRDEYESVEYLTPDDLDGTLQFREGQFVYVLGTTSLPREAPPPRVFGKDGIPSTSDATQLFKRAAGSLGLELTDYPALLKFIDSQLEVYPGNKYLTQLRKHVVDAVGSP